MKTQSSVTRKQLLSDEAMEAYSLARYRMRHNARYHNWSEKKRDAYAIGKAFDAALKERTE